MISALAGTGPDSSTARPETQQQLDVDDAVDDEERVPERAPEDPVGEELRVVGEADELRVLAVGGRR